MEQIVLQSKLFSKTRKEAPTDAEAVSHKLLVRGGYISQVGAGIYSMLPLGYRVQKNVEQIIREEINAVGGQEILMPALQPASLWQESGRLDGMDPPLFRVTDRHKKELVLASTHEEAVCDLARNIVSSYKDLPLAVYQIQAKFRNETRSTGGLLRVREFIMKDLYSFHASEKDLQDYYEAVVGAYNNIFKRCGLVVRVAQADSGTIGGAVSHEFQVEAQSGEDLVFVCDKCSYAANGEVVKSEKEACPECGGELRTVNCIESGHAFQLGTKYSQNMGVNFTDDKGEKKPVIMGCYGIGVGRLMATIAEVHHDEKGLKWPESVSPFSAHVLALQPSVLDRAKKLADKFAVSGSVLLDDRDVSPGQKFAESDLLGISKRFVVSERNMASGQVEEVNRISGETKLLQFEEVVGQG